MVTRSLRPVRSAPAVRTCVGCRVRTAKSDLLRLVAAGGDIVPDPQARLPGRGAYLHPSQECLELAQRRKALPRALRLPGPLGVGKLVGYLAGQCEAGPDEPRGEALAGSSGRVSRGARVRTGGVKESTAAVPGKRDQL
ncbi:MAG TPA: YlxR family protein [Streptosporangiaceae bacterium]|nr:YlxR family protein [Streptosporangiaceae bacterium]